MRDAPALAGLVESLEARAFPDLDLWVAVAKGADARTMGGAADVALGLGAGTTREDAETRALGECLERLGAALVPDGTPPGVPARTFSGSPAGWVPAARVYLPYRDALGPVLPATSEGLAFAFDRQTACLRAGLELIERVALRDALSAGHRTLRTEGEQSCGKHTSTLYRLPAPMPVILAVLADPWGRISGAGSAADPDPQAAAERAVREAALAHLAAEGEVLPGSIGPGDALLAPFGVRMLRDLRTTGIQLPEQEDFTPAGTFDALGIVFADATPPAFRSFGGVVFRALRGRRHA
ncbi:MAG: YcaO-like family protein [Alphaproteobacteria bacterium]|nr:YcaO-like family protein [Alphaproteobacteria bacterium]MDX5370428.1 YcaO-like family protein [Alphaproteobacteria bacterium]MDX5464936.1 YcaO-like family protein [Alphaproteobacteria bacterium]